MPRDQSPVLPSSVDVYFRAKQCYCPPTGQMPMHPVPNFYVSRRPIADYFPAVGSVPAVAGHPGAKIFHDEPYAIWSVDQVDPDNKAELDALAGRVAKDYYGWQDFSYDRVYNGLVDFVAGGPPYGGTVSKSELEANTDTITWSYRPGYTTTRLSCGTYNGTPEELSHATGEDCCDRRNIQVLVPTANDQGIGGFAGFHVPIGFLSIDHEALASCPCLDETCIRTICLHFHQADTGAPVKSVQILDAGYIDLGNHTHSLGSGVADDQGEFCFLAQPINVLVAGYYVKVAFDAAWGGKCTVREQFGLGFDPFPCGSKKDVHFSLCSYEYCFTGVPAGSGIVADYGCPEKFGDGTPHQPDWAKCHDAGCPNLCSTRVGDCFRVGGIGSWPQPPSEPCTYPLVGTWEVDNSGPLNSGPPRAIGYLSDCGILPPVSCGSQVTIPVSMFPLGTASGRVLGCGCVRGCIKGHPPTLSPVQRTWAMTLFVQFTVGGPYPTDPCDISPGCSYFGTNTGVEIQLDYDPISDSWKGTAPPDGSQYTCVYTNCLFGCPTVSYNYGDVSVELHCDLTVGRPILTYSRSIPTPCPSLYPGSQPGCLPPFTTGAGFSYFSGCPDVTLFADLHDPCGPASYTFGGNIPNTGRVIQAELYEK